MSEPSNVRVRIAPSPTGDPHVGTAYVALFNSIFASQNNGQFVLRIEDTDRTRARASSEKMIEESLSWLGLTCDESPSKGGPYGPYRQSERLEIYHRHCEQLIEDGHAYPCFCTSEDLVQMRKEAREQGRNHGYDRRCRELSSDQISANKEKGLSRVVRLKMPTEGDISFEDEIRGRVTIPATQLDDQIILKADGFPTYHLANVVDDRLMKISHVIRAEEWISSTPKHVHLYRCFGWHEPKWVHLPLLRNLDKSKISKRKNPVSLTYYRRAGILPEAMVNFLSLMGWSFGGDQEIFTFEEMAEKFRFKDISLGGPIFDQSKLEWINQNYLQKLSESQFVENIRERVVNESYLRRIYPLMRERITRFDDFFDRAGFFFNGALDYSTTDIVPKSVSKKDVRKMALALAEKLDVVDDWEKSTVEQVLNLMKEELGWKPKDFFMPLRLITTGRKDSPPLIETLVVLGSDMVRFRLRDAAATVLKG